MVQANEKPDKTHDMLTKELNKLKTDLNNEGNMDTDLTKRQVRSTMIVVPTHIVHNASQVTTVNTTDPQSNTPLLWIQSMCSEMPNNTYNCNNARLFSDLMKITVVIENLSLKQSNVLYKQKHYQDINI